MELKSFLKKTAKTAIFIIAADRLMLLPSAVLLPYFYSPDKLESSNTTSFKREKELGALEYLVLAHSISYNILDENSNNCKGYAIETFRTYKLLIEEDRRQDLADDVRIAFGNVTGQEGPALHVWTEIRQGNKWMPYETTTPETDIRDGTLLNLISLVKAREGLAPGAITDYLPITTMQANQDISRINPRWFYKSIGAIIPMIHTEYRTARGYIKGRQEENPKDNE